MNANKWVVDALVLLTVIGCETVQTPTRLSYEARLKRAETALRNEKIYEAQKWAEEALKVKPKSLEAQKIVAKVFDWQVAHEKKLSKISSKISKEKAHEELTHKETTLQVKTLLERSRTLLDMNLLKEANDTAEEAFQLDPGNLEASRLLDAIKEKAQKEGREESLFLEKLYQEEIQSRIERYNQQAEDWIAKKQWGGARIAVEKVLLLDPSNATARKLLGRVEKEDNNAWASNPQEVPDSV